MAAPSQGWFLVIQIGGFVLAALLVAAALRYSTRRGVVDAPGPRSSHVAPTPRGGGIGVVLAFVLGLALLILMDRVAPRFGVSLGLALIAVAGIGWLDDHRPQPALRRLLVHVGAAALIIWAMFGWPQGVLALVFSLVAILIVVTAINFSNFMDGSNGMLTIQCMAVGALLMLLAVSVNDWSLALLASLLVGTAAGLLPFNFPLARIFMGDVGSGALGLVLGTLTVAVGSTLGMSLFVALICSSALWLDAGLTLTLRLLTGRKWYRAHRSHLFQWLIRRGYSHARVAYLWLAWTLLIAAPLALAARMGWMPELMAFGMVLAVGSGSWWLVRRAVLRDVVARARAQRPRAKQEVA